MDFLGRTRPLYAANSEGDNRESIPGALVPVQDFLKRELEDAQKNLAILSRPESPAEKARADEMMEEEDIDWETEHHRELLVNRISFLGAKIKTLKGLQKEFDAGNYQPTLTYLNTEIETTKEYVQKVQEIVGGSKRMKSDIDTLLRIRDILQTYLSKNS